MQNTIAKWANQSTWYVLTVTFDYYCTVQDRSFKPIVPTAPKWTHADPELSTLGCPSTQKFNPLQVLQRTALRPAPHKAGHGTVNHKYVLFPPILRCPIHLKGQTVGLWMMTHRTIQRLLAALSLFLFPSLICFGWGNTPLNLLVNPLLSAASCQVFLPAPILLQFENHNW